MEESPPVGETEQAAGESTATEGQRSMPTPFLTKTYQLVDDPDIDDVVSWSGDGSTFVVWRPAEFSRDLLPKYFKHNNFSSFVRQLNTYGFRKVVPDRWEFANDSFKRGEKRLLCEIHRRKISATPAAAATATVTQAQVVGSPLAAEIPAESPDNSGDEQVISSNSSLGAAAAAVAWSSAAELRDENARLRRENAQLSRELAQIKGLCDGILRLMSRYSNNHPIGGSVAPEAPSEAERRTERRTMEAEACPMLFGVAIGSKRVRDEESAAAASEMKLEADRTAEDSPDHQKWSLCCSRPNQRVCNG